MQSTVFLFDLDGVLVKPGGYRAAVRATVNYFTRQLGLGDLAPSNETIAIFEAQGITSEWDMVPLLLCIVLETAAQGAGGPLAWHSFQAACDGLRETPPSPLGIDFAPHLRALGRFVRPGEAPSDSVLAACLSGAAYAPFPRIAEQGVLKELLSDTRRLVSSRTTAVFETFALGHAVYAQATGLLAEVRSAPLLALHDQPLLSSETRETLRRLSAQPGLRMSAYTARPSRPDRPSDEFLALFAPEAEMALDLIGWPDLPLVGSGQTGEMGRQLGEHEERLIKPSPYHALAAVAAAWTGSRPAALEWMRLVFCFFERGGPHPTLLTAAGTLPAALNLHIFEDSPAGMRGGLAAVTLLETLGMPVTLHLWGVSSHSEKTAALQAVGAQVFEDVNQAVSAALETVN